jgi:DNA-binding HxlR family transcriptional regulator
MDALLRLLMGPWTTYILWVLQQDGPTRFGALKRKVLTERLRMLEAAGVIFRRYEAKIPPEVTYGLTPRGRELDHVLESLDTLAKRWQIEDQAALTAGTARGTGVAAAHAGA